MGCRSPAALVALLLACASPSSTCVMGVTNTLSFSGDSSMNSRRDSVA